MDPFSPFAVTGLNPGAGPATTSVVAGGSGGIAGTAGPTPSDMSPIYHPNHPMFWVGAFVLVTYGLIGVNGAARVGKFKAGISAGKA